MASQRKTRVEATSSFSRNYLQVIRRLLEARWRGTPMHAELEDAIQEVFVECLRSDGPLSRIDPERGGVSGVLFGVTRNIARRFEERGTRLAFVLDEGSFIVRDQLGIDTPIALVGVAEKGYLSVELTLEMAGGHSSRGGCMAMIPNGYRP